MSKTRVFIYGSCVSRDTFEHFDPEEFALVEYVARQSVLSAYTKPVELMSPPTLGSRFQQRMVTGDFSSSLRSLLSTHGSATDLVLVDLTDERLGAYLLPDGSMVTRSVELIESGAEQHLPQGTQHIAFGTQQHFEYWTTAMNYIGERFQHYMPRATIVLLDLAWAEWSESGAQTPDSFGVRAADANSIFRPYVQVAAQALGAHVVSLEPAEVLSGPHHPWGDAPFHYAEKVYLETVRRLTGTEGRVVWGPGARSGSQRAVPAATSDGVPQQAAAEARKPAQTVPTTPPDLSAALSSGMIAEELTRVTWRLRRDDGTHAVEPIFLNPDGTVAGNASPNEARWAITEGDVAFTNDDGRVTTLFSQVASDASGGLLLQGQFVLVPSANITHVIEPTTFDWDKRKKNPNLTSLLHADEVKDRGWLVGDHSQGRLTVPQGVVVEIGKYCTFESDVQVLDESTDQTSVTAYPFQRLRAAWPSALAPVQGSPRDRKVTFGNDVHVGSDVMIMAGVTVGDGAVLTAGTVVVDDVPPYAVVSGTPGSVTRMRFREDHVRRLLTIRWWDWTDEQVDAMLPLLLQPDVGAFIARADAW